MRTKKPVRYAAILALVLSLLLTSVTVAQFSPSQLPGSGWWTGIQLQNVGSGPANVTVDAYPTNGNPPTTYTASGIPVGGQTTLTPITLGLAAGFEGSAVVSSNQPLNAVTNVTNRYASNGALGTDQGRAAGQYQGVAGSITATDLNFPLVKNDVYGKTTTFYIQNAGSDDATIELAFRMSDTASPGAPCGPPITATVTPDIEPGRMVVVMPGTYGVRPGCVGALTVTSMERLAGVVMEHHTTLPPVTAGGPVTTTAATLVQATRSLTPDDEDETAYAPIIKHDFGHRTTGIQVQNAGTDPVSVTISYVGTPHSNSKCTGPIADDERLDLPPGESHTWVPGSALNPSTVPDECLASATITATPAGSRIVAIVNEAFVPARVGSGKEHARDAAVTSFAIPAHSATRWVSAPLFKENAFSKTTGLQVQNVGDADTDVRAVFTCGGGGNPPTATTTYTVTVPSPVKVGGSYTFVTLFDDDDSMFEGDPVPEDISGFEGVCSAIVEADEPIVAVANESSYPFFDFRDTTGNIEQDKNNYEAFNLAADLTTP